MSDEPRAEIPAHLLEYRRVLRAVNAEIAWQDAQGVEFGHVTGHDVLGVQIHNAAVAIRRAMRLTQEGGK